MKSNLYIFTSFKQIIVKLLKLQSLVIFIFLNKS